MEEEKPVPPQEPVAEGVNLEAEEKTPGSSGRQSARVGTMASERESLRWATGKRTPATLTWQDLTVTVTDFAGQQKTILKGATGYCEPGQLLAVMGSSGSGKTTMMDALAGRVAKNATLAGEILVNGQKQSLSYGASAYVVQDDNLMGVLTVRETIWYGAMLRLPLSIPYAKRLELVDEVIQEMGLTDVADTYIGNWHLSGVSGGQRRRVSIAMELVTRPSLLFLDEPTSGLDAAAAFHVMAAVKALAVVYKRTVIAVVHQPSAEVFTLFDTLALLSLGEMVYFGKSTAAIQHFEDAAVPCPPHMNVAEHLLHSTNKDFDQAVLQLQAKGSVAVGMEAGKETREATVRRLVTLYNAGPKLAALSEKIKELNKEPGEILQRSLETSRFFFIYQVLILTMRMFTNYFRDLGAYWMLVGMFTNLMICMGTIYFRLGYHFSNIFDRVGCLAFIALFFPFQAIAGFPQFVEILKVFQRERLNGYYGVGTFVVSHTLSSLPFVFLLSLISGAVGYWLMNLRATGEAFIFFVLQYFASLFCAESMMMSIAALIPNFFWGIIVWAAVLGLYMLTCGFLRLPAQLPDPVWRYPFHYVSFHTWDYQGYLLNEFVGSKDFEGERAGSPRVSGQEALAMYGLGSGGLTRGKKWWCLGVVLFMILFYRALFVLVVKIKENPPPLGAVLAYFGGRKKEKDSADAAGPTTYGDAKPTGEAVRPEEAGKGAKNVHKSVRTTITWKNVKVSAYDPKAKTHLDIVKGVSGFCEAGSLLGIMGASGSGKTTLLNALSNRLPKGLELDGEVLVNGRQQQLTYGVANFVAKEDVLMGVLTVRECVYYAAQLRLPLSLSAQEKMAMVDEALVEMGLQDAANTAIGNWHLRGVSGGQRRRVTVAMELITSPTILFLDEPTSGLDSAAAFHVMAAVRDLVKEHGRTVICVLQQPSSEVFELLDSVVLLSSGRTVYFGPADESVRLFEEAGLPCPEHMNVADHFLYVTNTDFEGAMGGRSTVELRKVLLSEQTDSSREVAALLELGDTGRSELTDKLIATYEGGAGLLADKQRRALASSDGAELVSPVPSGLRFWFHQVDMLIRRSLLNIARNIGIYWLRLNMYVGLSICIGTTFWRIGTTYESINERALILGFITGFYGFMSIAGFPAFLEDIKVFLRERLNGYYGVLAFSISNFLSTVPIFFAIALVNTLILYWMIGLRNDVEAVIFFVLHMWAALTTVESVMVAVAALVPNYVVGMIAGAGYLGVFILTCGYFRLPPDLPAPVWRYPVHYISAYSYLFQGFLKNEFDGLTFDSNVPGAPRLTSQDALNRWGLSDGGIVTSKWADFAILWCWAIFYRLVFFVLIKIREGGPVLRAGKKSSGKA